MPLIYMQWENANRQYEVASDVAFKFPRIQAYLHCLFLFQKLALCFNHM